MVEGGIAHCKRGVNLTSCIGELVNQAIGSDKLNIRGSGPQTNPGSEHVAGERGGSWCDTRLVAK